MSCLRCIKIELYSISFSLYRFAFLRSLGLIKQIHCDRKTYFHLSKNIITVYVKTSTIVPITRLFPTPSNSSAPYRKYVYVSEVRYPPTIGRHRYRRTNPTSSPSPHNHLIQLSTQPTQPISTHASTSCHQQPKHQLQKPSRTRLACR